MFAKANTPAIAIIDMSCYYAGANKLKQFWKNILARRRVFRQFSDGRLPVSKYYPDRKAPDKTYGSRAAVIDVDGFKFDWANQRVLKKAEYRKTQESDQLVMQFTFSWKHLLAAPSDCNYMCKCVKFTHMLILAVKVTVLSSGTLQFFGEVY